MDARINLGADVNALDKQLEEQYRQKIEAKLLKETERKQYRTN